MDYSGKLIRGAVYIVNASKYFKNRETKYVICLQKGKITKYYNNFTAIVINRNKIDKVRNSKHYISKVDVHIPPEVCKYELGAVAKCSQIYTFSVKDILDYAYTIPNYIMEEIDQKLLFGIGLVSIEDL